MISINLYKQQKNIYLESKSNFFKKLILSFTLVLIAVLLIKSFFLYQIFQFKQQNSQLLNKLKK